MGSLSSRPSVPQTVTPQVVFVPQAPAPVSTSSSTETSNTESNASSSTNTDGNAQASASEQRTQNLLQRSRGRFGTILTSLSGLLTPVQAQGQRKTLLGE